MRRDWDLIRDILLRLEARSLTDLLPTDQVGYHLQRMAEAGMISLTDTGRQSPGGAPMHDVELTWAGWDWLALMRDDDHWKRVTDGLLHSYGAIPSDMLRERLMRIGR